MFDRVLHGILVGAALCGIVGVCECALVLAGHPYHRDPALWSAALWPNLLAGALLGIVGALLLPMGTTRRERQAAPGLQLGCVVAALLVAVVVGWLGHTSGIGAGTGPFTPRGMLASVFALVAGALTLVAARRVARSGLGWRIASLLSPPVLVAGLLLLLLAAPASYLLPVAAAPLAPHPGPRPTAAAPNVLLVVLDTVRADRLGCYGHFRATSPELDALAGEGVLFEQAFSTAPWTLPSHASILTGLHPSTHGAGWEYLRLGDTADGARQAGITQRAFRTLAEEFGAMGWDTCGLSQKGWLNHRTGLTKGFRSYHDFAAMPVHEKLLVHRIWRQFRGPAPGAAADKGAARIVDRTLEWIDDGRGRDQDRPFFLFLNLNEAHAPYWPPQEEREAFLPAGVDRAAYQAMLPFQTPESRKEFECGLRAAQPRESEILQALYDAEIRYQDAQLGRLIAGLEELDLLENTLVVVTADHGEEFGKLGRLGHQFALSDDLLHVPLVMRFPRGMPAGVRVSELASTVDLYPTLLDFARAEAGIAPPVAESSQMGEGVSLRPMLVEGADAPRELVLAGYANPSWYLALYPCQGEASDFAAGLDRSIAMIRTLEEKCLVYGDGSARHVDLRRDPDEAGVSLDDPAVPASGGRLVKRLAQLQSAYLSRWLALSNPLHGVAAMPDRAPLAEAGYVDSGPNSAAGAVPPPPLPRLDQQR